MGRIKLNKEDYIGRGVSGTVYARGDKAVKILNYYPEPHEGRDFLREEFFIGNILFNAGIHVPKFYGIYRVNLGGYKTFGLLMQRIFGENLGSGNLSKKVRAQKLEEMFEEIKKVKKLGIELMDARSGGNAIVCNITGKVYLVDFEDVDYPKYLTLPGRGSNAIPSSSNC